MPSYDSTDVPKADWRRIMKDQPKLQTYPDAISRAEAWLGQLFTEVKAQGGIWTRPHITTQGDGDGDGDVVFEWWQGPRSLSVFVSVNDERYLQSSGSNSEQSEGNPNTEESRTTIWKWLTEEDAAKRNP